MKPLHAFAKQVFVAGLWIETQREDPVGWLRDLNSVLNNSSFPSIFVRMGGSYCIACCSLFLPGRLLLRLFAMISYRDIWFQAPTFVPSPPLPLFPFSPFSVEIFMSCVCLRIPEACTVPWVCVDKSTWAWHE
ncbi:uncharacterized protein LY89DRAFT_394368 [Mollisia scopiformis]|uniref:Uncharacterized protein n=1 Tax=Mollisia scopiformis TaxID=149040 RepID=A0A194XPX7_MOLSC|nr:uncharacterized protein LY89DRAFT_394368 [Mollisia scopiformis]KUJ22109.1 hypothetical protein LY89DRAFT_394368 [Mollisia scopiformis]